MSLEASNNHACPEKAEADTEGQESKHSSAFRQLGILDRFLAIWIFLAMAIGIILGNFVPSTGPALQRGKFVGVSIPISESSPATRRQNRILILIHDSCGTLGHDVPDLV